MRTKGAFISSNFDTLITDPDSTKFDFLIDALRNDFRGLFPHLRPIEDECFFFKQYPETGWGKAWIIEELTLNGAHAIREITLFIENNRIVRRREELHHVPGNSESPSFELPTDFVNVEFFARPLR